MPPFRTKLDAPQRPGLPAGRIDTKEQRRGTPLDYAKREIETNCCMSRATAGGAGGLSGTVSGPGLSSLARVLPSREGCSVRGVVARPPRREGCTSRRLWRGYQQPGGSGSFRAHASKFPILIGRSRIRLPVAWNTASAIAAAAPIADLPGWWRCADSPPFRTPRRSPCGTRGARDQWAHPDLGEMGDIGERDEIGIFGAGQCHQTVAGPAQRVGWVATVGGAVLADMSGRVAKGGHPDSDRGCPR
jgi:hypothetical protein